MHVKISLDPLWSQGLMFSFLFPRQPILMEFFEWKVLITNGNLWIPIGKWMSSVTHYNSICISFLGESHDFIKGDRVHGDWLSGSILDLNLSFDACLASYWTRDPE